MTDVLVGPRAAADVAGRACSIEEPLATDQLLLGQVDRLALAIHGDGHILKVSVGWACRRRQEQRAQEGTCDGTPRGGLFGWLLLLIRHASCCQLHAQGPGGLFGNAPSGWVGCDEGSSEGHCQQAGCKETA